MTIAADRGSGAPLSLPWQSAPVVGLAFAYCAFFLVLRNHLSPTITVDDVEQLIVVQDLSFGYRTAQPPLHGWLLWLVSQAAGPGLLALTLIKYGCLFGTVAFYHAAARRLLREPVYALLATVSLALIYLIAYKVHRGYTHSAVLLLTCAATFYFFVLLRDRRSLAVYALLGLSAGLAVLSKYNAVPLIVTLLVAGLATPAWGAALRDPRMLATGGLFLAVTAPYLHWAFVQAPVDLGSLAASRIAEPERGFFEPRLAGLGKIVQAYVSYLLPFAAAVLVVFPPLLSRRGWRGALERPALCLLAVKSLAGLGFMLALVLISGTSGFHARHLHPILVFTPILAFLIVEHKAPAIGVSARARDRRAWAYILLAGLATAAVATALVVRAGQLPPDCGKCRLQKPYPELAETLRERYGLTRGTLIAEEEFIGGNARAALPDMRLYSRAFDDVTPPAEPDRAARRCLVVWHAGSDPGTAPENSAERTPGPPPPFADFVARIRGTADWGDAEIRRLDVPFRSAPSVTLGFGYAFLPAAGDCY